MFLTGRSPLNGTSSDPRAGTPKHGTPRAPSRTLNGQHRESARRRGRCVLGRHGPGSLPVPARSATASASTACSRSCSSSSTSKPTRLGTPATCASAAVPWGPPHRCAPLGEPTSETTPRSTRRRRAGSWACGCRRSQRLTPAGPPSTRSSNSSAKSSTHCAQTQCQSAPCGGSSIVV